MKPLELAGAGRTNGTYMTAVRALIGFFIAPGIPALALYWISLFFVSGWRAEFWPVILAIVGYLAALVLGVPAHLLLRRKGVNSLTSYLIFGALIGLVCYLLSFAVSDWSSQPEHALSLIKNSAGLAVVSVVYATVASAVFWLIAIKNNP